MTGSEHPTVEPGAGSGAQGPTRARLVAGLVLAPAAWAFHFVAGISLVGDACNRGSELLLHVSTAVALPVALVGLWSAVRLRRELRDHEGNVVVGAAAVGLAAISIGLVVVEQLVAIPLEPCA